VRPTPRPGALPHDDVSRAVLYMAYAMALIPLLNASAKYLSRGYAIPEIVWARYAGHFFSMLIAFAASRHPPADHRAAGDTAAALDTAL
jgi:hypothetical protein